MSSLMKFVSFKKQFKKVLISGHSVISLHMWNDKNILWTSCAAHYGRVMFCSYWMVLIVLCIFDSLLLVLFVAWSLEDKNNY